MLHIICALTRNYAIGRNNGLLFHLSDDLKHFKKLTIGHTIIMGRRTFQSLPKGALPHRRNIVLSRNKTFCAPGAEVYASLEEALSHCEKTEDIFIIGGYSVYAEALPLADRLCLTEIETEVEDADTFFPKWDKEMWLQTSSEAHPTDERHTVPFKFTEYKRLKK